MEGRGSLCAPHVEDDVLPSVVPHCAWRSFHTSASAGCVHSYKSTTVFAVIYRSVVEDILADADAEVDIDVHGSDRGSSSNGVRDGNMEIPLVLMLDVQVQLRPIHAWLA